nr:zinc finger protein 45-like [Rhipicephalus microplus]
MADVFCGSGRTPDLFFRRPRNNSSSYAKRHFPRFRLSYAFCDANLTVEKKVLFALDKAFNVFGFFGANGNDDAGERRHETRTPEHAPTGLIRYPLQKLATIVASLSCVDSPLSRAIVPGMDQEDSFPFAEMVLEVDVKVGGSRLAMRVELYTSDSDGSCSLSSVSRERYHALVSVQGGLHSCRQCTYATKNSANMRTHLRRHTGERPFQCHLCPAAFFRDSHLAGHIRTHTGERPYSCDVCSASFSERSNLLKHIHTHTGERPYSCDVCNTSFLRKSHLINHMRTHSRERPFSCDQCRASFSQKMSLVRHMRNHTGTRPFSCDYCSASFSRNQDLVLHVSRYHETNMP